MAASEIFVQQLLHALRHLYDPSSLRGHPLIQVFGLAGAPNPPISLRDTLINAIRALKPAPTVPVSSRTWRVYQLLQCRYIQQLDQKQTANQLGLGLRHLKREQHIAVQILADSLAPSEAISDLPAEKNVEDTEKAWNAEKESASLQAEMAWMQTPEQQNTTHVHDVLLSALQVVGPVARATGVNLDIPVFPPLPPIPMHPTAFKQALVSLTALAIRKIPGGVLHLDTALHGDQIQITLTATGQVPLPPITAEETASLETARSILHMAQASFTLEEAPEQWIAHLVLPSLQGINVLLVDDNADIAQLITRYTMGTRYQIQAIQSAEHLFETIEEINAQIILLDMMLPGIDGWEILETLLHNPLTKSIPIVVCSVLPERNLALTLGAKDYLAKPVDRAELLSALDRAWASAPIESR
ncbi:MAG: response regulator [Bacteroidales bacterium]